MKHLVFPKSTMYHKKRISWIKNCVAKWRLFCFHCRLKFKQAKRIHRKKKMGHGSVIVWLMLCGVASRYGTNHLLNGQNNINFLQNWWHWAFVFFQFWDKRPRVHCGCSSTDEFSTIWWLGDATVTSRNQERWQNGVGRIKPSLQQAY